MKELGYELKPGMLMLVHKTYGDDNVNSSMGVITKQFDNVSEIFLQTNIGVPDQYIRTIYADTVQSSKIADVTRNCIVIPLSVDGKPMFSDVDRDGTWTFAQVPEHAYNLSRAFADNNKATGRRESVRMDKLSRIIVTTLFAISAILNLFFFLNQTPK